MKTILRAATPRARREGMAVQVLDDELLIFDYANETAHALNKPAAFVWQHADGTRTAEQLAREMSRAFDTSVDAHVVWYALEQLSKRNLLQENVLAPTAWQGMTRRQFLKRATAGAVVLAVVTSIVAPTPAHAQSGCFIQGTNCSDTAQCCLGMVCCEVGGIPRCEVPALCDI